MPRKTEVPEIKWNKHRGCWQLRFSHNGERYQPTFGKDKSAKGKSEAQKQAIKFYSDVISGRQKIESDDYGALPFRDVYVEFLTERASEVTAKSLGTFATYGKHYGEIFKDLRDLTSEGVGKYQRERLKHVQIETVRKERAKLGQFCRWLAEEKGYIEQAPVFPRISPKATGTKFKKRRRGEATPVTVDQIEAIIDLLPQWSRSRKGQPPFPIQDKFVVLWETGLRPDSTVGRIVAGVHFRQGERKLFISKDIDKNRWERTIPISERAAAAFERCWPESGKGLMFGEHDLRHHVQKAARKVLPPDLALRFTAYDLRHARITIWCSTQAHNLAGIALLVGDDINTLRHYCHPSELQAESVLGY